MEQTQETGSSYWNVFFLSRSIAPSRSDLPTDNHLMQSTNKKHKSLSNNSLVYILQPQNNGYTYMLIYTFMAYILIAVNTRVCV